jgi:hypothetical protein
MYRRLHAWLWQRLTDWLTAEPRTAHEHLSDFDRLRYEIRPADVLLVEGRSRVSYIIKTITLSSWTHSALYIGRLSEIESPKVRTLVETHYEGDPNEPLVIEALLGRGAIVTPLSNYREHHVRVCRPTGLSRRDLQTVLLYAARQLGLGYDVRQILDLARFMFPYHLLPRRWRSSLFAHNAGEPTHTVCSTMLAAAFHSVHFPVLPILVHDEAGEVRLFKRNLKLFTPKDFDHSPYFNIIKYPLLAFDELAVYRTLPWSPDGLTMNSIEECTAYLEEEARRKSDAPEVQRVNLLAALRARVRRRSPQAEE